MNYVKNVSSQDLVAFGPNPQNRTDESSKDYKELLAFVNNGGLVPPIKTVYCRSTNQHYVVDGHRRIQAGKQVGLTLDAVVLEEANSPAEAQELQYKHFASINSGKRIVGADALDIAIDTNGQTCIKTTTKVAWNHIKKNFDLTNLMEKEWLKTYATPDMLSIAEHACNYANNYYQGRGEDKTAEWRKSFFSKVCRWMVDFECQRDLRNTVARTKNQPKVHLIKAIENNKRYTKFQE